MPHQFNSFTGRIVESKHPQPFFPISATRLERVEPPTIMFDTPHTKPIKVAQPNANFSSTVPDNIVKKQKTFLKKNPLPVYIKGGVIDKGLFGLTMALTVLGIGMGGQALYELVKK